MYNTTVANIMTMLYERFCKEMENMNPMSPDTNCDTTFLKRYIRAYDYYKTYTMLPEGHSYKNYYSVLLTEILVEMGIQF